LNDVNINKVTARGCEKTS